MNATLVVVSIFSAAGLVVSTFALLFGHRWMRPPENQTVGHLFRTPRFTIWLLLAGSWIVYAFAFLGIYLASKHQSDSVKVAAAVFAGLVVLLFGLASIEVIKSYVWISDSEAIVRGLFRSRRFDLSDVCEVLSHSGSVGVKLESGGMVLLPSGVGWNIALRAMLEEWRELNQERRKSRSK